MNLKEVSQKAKELMMPQCRMCPECNGVACRGEVPGMGGKGTGSSFMNNYNELRKITLNMRSIHDVKEPDTSAEFFGVRMPIPVFPAPVTGVAINMGNKMTEKEYITGLIEGSRDSRIIPMVGDSAFKSFIEENIAALKEKKVRGIVFIKPWDNKELLSRVELAMESDPIAIGVDIDSCGLDTLKMHGHRVDPKTLDDLKEIKAALKVPFIIKGIMTPCEALLAVQAGADAIVVSNHGGRVLDSTPATCSVLSTIAEVAKGKTTIFVDGGVRSGVDVFKMLALGADGVLIGRPFAQYAIGGGSEGVSLYADKLRSELRGAMLLTGSKDIESIEESSINY